MNGIIVLAKLEKKQWMELARLVGCHEAETAEDLENSLPGLLRVVVVVAISHDDELLIPFKNDDGITTCHTLGEAISQGCEIFWLIANTRRPYIVQQVPIL
jgi:hypothetical protein